ncbi:RNA polymerase sigma factor SigM [Planctomycetes bacterium K23_9]|uniref:RNA polymerase sigma factor SigM n=1 Tax=Stieleria marina TaxID=1930275 RepID=A0A517P0C9_9BACT|nr:RNA polymerase sigma factor SigM [Planctomycetes bacterium K23_9]
MQFIAEHQNRIYGYVYSMLGDHTSASDVVQETNLVLWRKKDQFDPSAAFLPWAFGIARMQVLAHVRDLGRSRCVLDQELVEMMSAEAEAQSRQMDSLQAAMRRCLSEMPPKHRDMIQTRYFKSASIKQVAEVFDRGVSDVKVTLLRLRQKLRDCVVRRMEGEA